MLCSCHNVLTLAFSADCILPGSLIHNLTLGGFLQFGDFLCGRPFFPAAEGNQSHAAVVGEDDNTCLRKREGQSQIQLTNKAPATDTKHAQLRNPGCFIRRTWQKFREGPERFRKG
jgi:hypothetical protein